MNSDRHRLLKPGGARLPASRLFVSRACLLLSAFWLLNFATSAATFSGNARVEVTDSTGGLSWNGSALTIACWFKMSVPTGTNLTENMTILANRRAGSPSDAGAYLVQYNVSNGAVEFVSSSGGQFMRPLIDRPYLDRWYHVAVTRDSGGNFVGYVDGRKAFEGNGAVGTSTDGVSIGGWNATGSQGRYFWGEIIEVAIHQQVLTPTAIRAFMFADLPVTNLAATLKGYFKLAAVSDTNLWYRNLALNPSNDTANGMPFGPIVFEELDVSGEQSLFDSCRNGGADAVASLSGALAWEKTAFARPTPGVAFDFRFGYSSANAGPGAKLGEFDPFEVPDLGRGWRHTFEARILPEGGLSEVRLLTWNGAIETWLQATNDANGTLYRTRHKEYRGELRRFLNGDFEWTTPERLIYRFRNPFPSEFDPPPDDPFLLKKGFLQEIRDFNSNVVHVSRDQLGRIDDVTDTAGGAYSFSYTNNQIRSVAFGAWQVRFGYDQTSRLISKSLTNTSGLYPNVNTAWQFVYFTNGPSSNLLSHIVDPRSITNATIQYDQYGRQTNQVDELNRATASRYGVPGKRQITRIDPGTNAWIETYDRKGHITAQQDPLTNITSYAYDTNGNRISITEPLGWTTSFGYDSRANVLAKTNALGEVTRWEMHQFFNKATRQITPQPADTNGWTSWTNFYAYDAGGNLTNHADALGSLVRYTYATNGLVLTSTDANGNTSQFAYDTNGFLIARTDPAINTWQFTVNDVGWKLAEINPFNDTTFLAYDLNGNPVQTTDPLNRTFTRQYDANGNLLAQSDGKNVFTRHAYDAANQRVATTNRVGSVWQFTFTSRGKPDRATDPLGNTTTNFYDSANRLVAVSDPLGNSITNQYDPNGNSVALFDTLGQRWSKTFDRLNRVIAEADPLGDTKSTTFDATGRIKTITTPNGFPSQHEYDGRGRLTKWKDAEGFDWLYAYDGNGNITNITDALNGHYVMTYGPRNERTLERNQDNFEWQYTYDQLLRLKTQRDPNLTLRTRNYDPAGRVTSHTLSTGREDTYAYDDNDNPRVIVRRVNSVAVATTSLTYDALDRATRVVDPHSQSVDYSFDALSRVVSVTYPGNHTLTNRYDALSRLTNQVDWAARQMSYEYDRAGRLIRRAYPNGVVQTNTFDSAGRLTGLSHSPSTINSNSINMALTYAYDRNGNKVGNTERGTFAWPMPSLVDETSRFTAAGRITNRVDALNPTNNFAYQYDASGNMTNAVGGGQSWRLTYDEDNRTTSILWDAGITSKLITNRYDALGRRIARKVDGIETRYVLDLSGGMERILCDTTASGQVTTYYIHGPDLCYRVDATNNVICYHADAQANIIAVTDGGGSNVAQYAYTPYGRSLGSSVISNLQSQISNPYTFVGSQGVMEELPGLYFMRARYYSADTGVFLSTDPMKKIGPGWKPVVYGYVNGNPMIASDPKGETPLHVAAFLLGVKNGMVEGVVEAGIEDLLSELPVSFGVPESAAENITGAAFDYLSAGKTAIKTYQYGRTVAAAGDPSRLVAAYALGEVVGGKAGKSIYSLSGKLMDGYMTAINQTGSAIGGVLYDKFGVGALPPLILPSSSANNLMASRTPDSSTRPTTLNAVQSTPKSTPAGNSGNNNGGSGGSGGSTTPSNGGGTYTVKAGDTLGNIGYNFGSSATAIGAANGIQNLNLIHPGQVLTIPRR